MANKIIVYTSPMCHYCHALGDWLKKEKVKFLEKDVSKNDEARDELLEKSGQLGVPTSVITDKNGNETVVVGFNPEKLKKALNL